MSDIVIRPLAEILLLARLSSAAYVVDEAAREAAVNALGPTYLRSFGNESCCGYACLWDQRIVVALQGTRVETHLDLAEIWDDLEGDPVQLPDGVLVHGGFWRPLDAVWTREIGPWLNTTSRAIEITGHSLGGVRAHLAGYFSPGRVTSFGAPKGAYAEFWRGCYAGREPPLRVVHAADFAPEWPFWGGYVHPSAMLWLNPGGLAVASRRPGENGSIADHSIDAGYIAALDRLVAAPGASA
jgi:hypothetical protein